MSQHGDGVGVDLNSFPYRKPSLAVQLMGIGWEMGTTR